jgi:hypothetical protein
MKQFLSMKKSASKVFSACLIVLSLVSYVYVCHTESTLEEQVQQHKIEFKESSEKIVSQTKLLTVVVDRVIKVISSNY